MKAKSLTPVFPVVGVNLETRGEDLIVALRLADGRELPVIRSHAHGMQGLIGDYVNDIEVCAAQVEWSLRASDKWIERTTLDGGAVVEGDASICPHGAYREIAHGVPCRECANSNVNDEDPALAAASLRRWRGDWFALNEQHEALQERALHLGLVAFWAPLVAFVAGGAAMALTWWLS